MMKLFAKEPKTIWQQYSDESKRYIQNGEYGLYRNTRFNMAEHLCKEKKYRQALDLFVEVLYWDLNDCKGVEELKILCENKIFKIAPYNKSSVILPPGVLKRIAVCQKEADISDEQLRAVMSEMLVKLSSPVRFFTSEEIVAIFFWTRDGNETALKKVFSTANKRFDINHPNAVGSQ